MEHNEHMPLGERVAKLETRLTHIENDIKELSTKIDSLLELKLKGMGALWFVWLIVGSGLLGLITTAINIFGNKPHL